MALHAGTHVKHKFVRFAQSAERENWRIKLMAIHDIIFILIALQH